MNFSLGDASNSDQQQIVDALSAAFAAGNVELAETLARQLGFRTNTLQIIRLMAENPFLTDDNTPISNLIFHIEPGKPVRLEIDLGDPDDLAGPD